MILRQLAEQAQEKAPVQAALTYSVLFGAGLQG